MLDVRRAGHDWCVKRRELSGGGDDIFTKREEVDCLIFQKRNASKTEI